MPFRRQAMPLASPSRKISQAEIRHFCLSGQRQRKRKTISKQFSNRMNMKTFKKIGTFLICALFAASDGSADV
jgi:hypothetical protein